MKPPNPVYSIIALAERWFHSRTLVEGIYLTGELLGCSSEDTSMAVGIFDRYGNAAEVGFQSPT
jgi:hypothetical protein